MTTPLITRLEEAEKPKPGSDAAINGGCTCPVSDNRRGQGIPTDVGTCFYYSDDCPMHSHPANDQGQAMTDTVTGCAKTPLSDLLRRIPQEAVYSWTNPEEGRKLWQLGSESAPIGRLAHEAADALDAMLAASPQGEGSSADAHPPQPDALPGDLRERVARLIDPSAFLFSRDELDAKVRQHPHDAAYALADAILDLIQSERGWGMTQSPKALVHSGFASMPGEVVRPDKYDPDPRWECTHGIHFFQTREEAEAYR